MIIAILSHHRQNSPTLQLLIQTLNVNKKHQIKWYYQGRRRKPLGVSFWLPNLFKIFIHMIFFNCLRKVKWQNCFKFLVLAEQLFVVTRSSYRLLDYSVTKLRCYIDVFVNMLFSCTIRLWNILPVQPFLWPKWL